MRAFTNNFGFSIVADREPKGTTSGTHEIKEWM
jgi:hypothetical protein